MNDAAVAVVSILLVAANFFFVAAEYALVGSRRSRLEAMAKRGHRGSRRVLAALEDLSPLVASNQISITMLGIAMGSITEPVVTAALQRLFGQAVPAAVSFAISYCLITYVIVVAGELVPKYLTLKNPERVAFVTVAPVTLTAKLFYPLVWLAQNSASLLLRPFGVRLDENESPTMAKDELFTMLRAGKSDLEDQHADFVAKALKLDDLDAADIMVHRLDIKWLDLETPRAHLLGKIAEVPHSRFPVCRGDIDDLVGIVYLHDLVRDLDEADFSLESIARPAVVIPESLTLDRIITRMREDRTQILIVVDEYGGTSGLITLEDVVEEVFGELEDRLESERSPIEVFPSGRVSARADVRFDELVERLAVDLHDPSTDTLAQMIADGLGRVPKIGDYIDSPVGLMRVENMARRRVTRVSIRLREALRSPS